MTYRIDVSETAEAEIDAAYLWISGNSPEQAGRWHAGLLSAIASLAEMPGRCSLARENGRFEEEIRQLLYGRGRNIYRILFVVRETANQRGEASVRILHVRHSAQQTLGELPTE
jgi:plasmid stabilization system protein ParE